MLSPGLLTHWTRQALDAAFAGDEGMVAVTADLIADGGDALDLLSSCRVVADTAVRALLVLYRAPDTAGGEVWVLDQLGDTECPLGCCSRPGSSPRTPTGTRTWSRRSWWRQPEPHAMSVLSPFGPS